MSELPELSTVSPNSEGDLIGPVTGTKPGLEVLPQEQEGVPVIDQQIIPNVKTPRTKLQTQSDVYTDKKLPTEPKGPQEGTLQPKPQEDITLPSFEASVCAPDSVSEQSIFQVSTQGEKESSQAKNLVEEAPQTSSSQVSIFSLGILFNVDSPRTSAISCFSFDGGSCLKNLFRQDSPMGRALAATTMRNSIAPCIGNTISLPDIEGAISPHKGLLHDRMFQHSTSSVANQGGLFSVDSCIEIRVSRRRSNNAPAVIVQGDDEMVASLLSEINTSDSSISLKRQTSVLSLAIMETEGTGTPETSSMDNATVKSNQSFGDSSSFCSSGSRSSFNSTETTDSRDSFRKIARSVSDYSLGSLDPDEKDGAKDDLSTGDNYSLASDRSILSDCSIGACSLVNGFTSEETFLYPVNIPKSKSNYTLASLDTIRGSLICECNMSTCSVTSSHSSEDGLYFCKDGVKPSVSTGDNFSLASNCSVGACSLTSSCVSKENFAQFRDVIRSVSDYEVFYPSDSSDDSTIYTSESSIYTSSPSDVDNISDDDNWSECSSGSCSLPTIISEDSLSHSTYLVQSVSTASEEHAETISEANGKKRRWFSLPKLKLPKLKLPKWIRRLKKSRKSKLDN